MIQDIIKLWKDAKTPLQYIVAGWVTLLSALVSFGLLGLLYKLIIDPLSFSNITYGIFDTIG